MTHETDAPPAQVVRGELAFDGTPVDLAGASVRIVVNDVSRADAAAVPAAEQRITALPPDATTASTIPFEMRAGPLSARSRYSLWAHVDVDRDGQVGVGDFITMEEYPVVAGTTTYHRIQVRRVG